MKLFQRTLWSFVGVIALQAGLAGAALSAILGSMQAEDASREMATGAANAYESFNAWKLAFWKEINELAEDERLAAAVGSSKVSPVWDEGVARELSRRQSSSAASAMAVRDEKAGLSRYVGVEHLDMSLPDPASFSYQREHPYVEIVSTRGRLWFVGAVRVPAKGAVSRELDVFIVKKIDDDLVGHLSFDPMIAVAVSLADGGPIAAARFSGTAGSGRSGERAVAFAQDMLGPAAGRAGRLAGSLGAGGGGEGELAYMAYPRMERLGKFYSAVVRRAGTVATPKGERTVLLAAVLSLEEYSSRVAMLQRSVIAISLVVVAITIVVALVLSRSIVSPIGLLSRATRRIAEGDYRAEVRGPVAGEIGELLESFNGMARKLASDKLELERYIAEIVGLKERADGIIESMREGIAVVDAEGRIESANSSFRSLFGNEAAATGSRIAAIERGPFDEALVEAARDSMRNKGSRGGITRRAVDGRTFEIKLYPLVAASRPEDARCIVIVEDASERLAYEERVLQAEKLASIGMLSAGVAHEINNPLSSILANVGNAISETEDPEMVASLRVVEGETHRIARIVRQLLDFSAPRRSRSSLDGFPPRCDANEVTRELVRLVGYPFKGDGRIEFQELLDPDCPEVAIPADELKQVLINLLKNALEAVGGEGRIRVETRAAGASVEISVSDDGPGIPESLIGRIFDPFFSTKQASPEEGGAGLGLGLSVAYGIVTKRGGSIRAVRAEGGGASFLVVLQAAEAPGTEPAGGNDGLER